MPLVAPEHRPTLGDLLEPRIGRRALWVLAGLAVLAAALLLLLTRGSGEGEVVVVQRAGPAPFNLVHTAGLRRVAPAGDELLRLEARRPDGLFVQSFAVEPLRLPAYRGEVGGALPVEAAREIERLRRRFADFELVRDGKARVNDVPGYAISFRARLGARRLYGRVVLLPEPDPGARDGVRLVLLATPAGGVSSATDVGVRGVTKRPFRTFRFGTERP
jgi:hypothetical protein